MRRASILLLATSLILLGSVGTSTAAPKRRTVAQKLLKRCFKRVPRLPRSTDSGFDRHKRAAKKKRDKTVRKIKVPDELATEVLEQVKGMCETGFGDDSGASEYRERISRISNRLLAQLPKRFRAQISFHLSSNPAVNAFMSLEGFGCVFRGLLKLVGDRDSMLAFVLAHEISHYLLEHVDDRVRHRLALENDKYRERELDRLRLFIEGRKLIRQFRKTLPRALRRELKRAEKEFRKLKVTFQRMYPEVVRDILKATAPLVTAILEAPYDQDDEYTADRLGLCLMSLAKFEVKAPAAFFEALTGGESSATRPSAVADWLSTHPSSSARIEFSKKLRKYLRKRR